MTAICAIAVKIDVSLGGTANRQFGDSFLSKSNIPIITYSYDADPFIVISQNVNEKGLVVIGGPFTNLSQTATSYFLSGKYQNAQGEW